MPLERAIEGMIMQGLTTPSPSPSPSSVRGRGWLAAAAPRPFQPRRALGVRPPARGGGAS